MYNVLCTQEMLLSLFKKVVTYRLQRPILITISQLHL